MKESIIKVVSNVFKINGFLIFEKNRKREIIEAKQMLIYYLRTVHSIRYYDIACFLNIDHASAISGLRRISDDMFIYEATKEKYNMFLAEMEKENLNMDYFVISRFLRENRKYISNDLKEYLKVRL